MSLPDLSGKDKLRKAALDYARRGWLIFPCIPNDKPPAFKGGFYSATTNPATIARWWNAKPYNIGIRTGACSHLWVVDIDPGGWLDGLPLTLEAATGRGRHLYFATGLDLPNTAGRIGPGIDTRGGGGYVIAPPSVHPSGAIYRWSIESEPATPPGWLIERARKQRNSERATTAAGLATQPGALAGAYGQAALNAEIGAVVLAPKGTRNNALNKAAFSLGQLVAGGELAADEVGAALWRACEVNGLLADDGPRQVDATIRSGLKAGAQHPRALP